MFRVNELPLVCFEGGNDFFVFSFGSSHDVEFPFDLFPGSSEEVVVNHGFIRAVGLWG